MFGRYPASSRPGRLRNKIALLLVAALSAPAARLGHRRGRHFLQDHATGYAMRHYCNDVRESPGGELRWWIGRKYRFLTELPYSPGWVIRAKVTAQPHVRL